MATKNIKIQVTDKRATLINTPVVVCGNSDYTATFVFDHEWSKTGPRTARFVYVRDGKVQYEDAVFTGDTVAVPVLENVTFVDVGVFAGNLCTTTPARVPCKKSILCGSGVPHDPTPDVYAQIMELFEEMAEKGAFGATEEQVRRLEVLEARMDTFTQLDEGATTADAEVADIRVGYDGKKYETAGEAVRGQVGQLLETTREEREQFEAEVQEQLDIMAPAIVETAAGDTILVQDSAARKPVGLKLFGKSAKKPVQQSRNWLQVTATTQTMEGVTCTVNEDKSVTVNGTSTDYMTFYLCEGQSLPVGSYILSGAPVGAEWPTAYMVLTNDTTGEQYQAENGEEVAFEITSQEDSSISCAIEVREGETVDNVTFYPMVRLATEEDNTYEPFYYSAGLSHAGAGGNVGVRVQGKNFLPLSKYTTNASGDTAQHMDIPVLEYGKTYVLSGKTTDGEVITSGRCQLIWANETGKIFKSEAEMWSTGQVVNVDLLAATTFYVYTVPALAGKTIQLQLEEGTAATDYEPYTEQTLTAATPNGLPGIPVASGGNYTDENGQQWLCDEIDFARGKYVSRVFEAVFTGAVEENWKASITSQDGKHRMTSSSLQPYVKGTLFSTVAPLLCTDYDAVASNSTGTWGCVSGMSVDDSGTVMVYDEAYNTDDANAWVGRLMLHPITCLFERKNGAVETDLTAEELAAYAALLMNYPTTTVLNDGGAGMGLDYVADTKLYIDNKLAQLKA